MRGDVQPPPAQGAHGGHCGVQEVPGRGCEGGSQIEEQGVAVPGPVRAQSPKAQPSRSLPEVSGQCHDRGVLGVSAIAADSCKKKSSDLLHLLPDRQGLQSAVEREDNFVTNAPYSTINILLTVSEPMKEPPNPQTIRATTVTKEATPSRSLLLLW